MLGKIGLEEHFAVEETVGHIPAGLKNAEERKKKLLDIFNMRVAEMDKYGMDLMILSLNSPAIQETCNAREAVDLARRCNDHLAECIARRPDRFRGFAALPMQDPEAAIEEMERCVKDYGFKGALVNGYSQIGSPDTAVYLDDKRYWPFWAKMQELDVPFYLHPRNPMKDQRKIYDGHPWLMAAAWAFTVETATHMLRLLCSGIFDEYPKLKLIVGHLGECVPFHSWRTQNRLNRDPRPRPFKLTIQEYLKRNVYVTTSGFCSTPALINTIAEMGVERVMFSTDYPFETVEDAATWFDNAEIPEVIRAKIGRENARALFNL